MKLLCPSCKSQQEIEITHIGKPEVTGEEINFTIIQCKACGYSYGIVDAFARKAIIDLSSKVDSLIPK